MCKCTEGVTRRQAMQAVAAAAAAFATASLPLGWTAAQDGKTRKVLFFTKSAGFEHSCIKRPDNHSDKELSHAERILVELGKASHFEVTATKDGSYFTPEKLAQFDVVAFYTTGDLTQAGTDGTPPMPKEGREALMKFIESGKGFVGFHCATDTFGKHVGGGDDDKAEAYIRMIGGEFDGHGAQQKSRIRAVKGFAPLKGVADFELEEEWYAFKNLAPDMHVILVQETQSMSEDMYKSRKPYPETWARTQGKGRVFYSSMGHREDVWTNPLFHQVILGGLAWAAGNVEADVKPNLKEACPNAEKVLKTATA
jgi:type 1 glutamine amidotransferase